VKQHNASRLSRGESRTLDRSKVPGDLRVLIVRAVQLLASVVLVLLLLAGNRIAQGGKSGFYEVRPDGSLGTLLGRRAPYDLRKMERMKPE